MDYRSNLPGLAGRVVLPVSPLMKAYVEKFAAERSQNGNWERSWCHNCEADTYRRPARAACRDCCSHPKVIRGYMRKDNGDFLARSMCLDCGGEYLNIQKTDTEPLYDFLLQDNTVRYASQNGTCERCGAAGSEVHHWAPSAIFNDAEEWPKSRLCPPCHRTWHSAMRRALGYRLPPDQRIGTNRWIAMQNEAEL